MGGWLILLTAKGEGAPWALSHDTDGPWVIVLVEPKSSKNNYRMEMALLHFFPPYFKKGKFVRKRKNNSGNIRERKKAFIVPSPFMSNN